MEAPRTVPEKTARDIRARRPALDSGLLLSRTRRVLSALTLATIDVSAVALAYYGGLITRQLYIGGEAFPGVLWYAVSQDILFIGLVVVLVFARAGLYRARESRTGGPAVLSSLSLVTLIIAVFALASGKRFHTYAIFGVSYVYAVILVTALRASYDSITLTLMRMAGMRRRTLLAGRLDELVDLPHALSLGGRGPDVEVIGAVTDDESAPPGGLQTHGRIADLPALVAELRPDDLVLSGVDLPADRLLELVERCRAHGTRLRVVPSTGELLLAQARFVPGQALPLFEVRAPVLSGIDWGIKRGFDLIVSAALLVVLSPLFALVALAIATTSGGGVLYRDRRIGVGEREFDMLKFRSMYRDAAVQQVDLEQLNEADGAMFKIRRDPRVTVVGRLIRRLSIDELPQLVNVLRGEMSLVGPRPLPLRDYELLEAWHRERYQVLPGITGLWQVSGRSSLSFDDLVRLDFYYLENWSLALDVAILLRTPLAVFRGDGAY